MRSPLTPPIEFVGCLREDVGPWLIHLMNSQG
jgi:hypothetical protein